jgi:TolA-binding protein
MRRDRIAAAALLVALALPARAALFDDEEARKRIETTNQRLTQVQRQLEDRVAALEAQLKSSGLVEMVNTVEQIRGDIAKVRGQLEVLTYELDQQSKRQRDLYVDVDTRLRKLETAAAAPPAAPAASAAPPADATAEQRAYDAALDQFKGGNYAAASSGFAAFVKTYPKSPLAASAQYWLGNAQFGLRDYRGAIASQRALVA